MHPRPEGGRPAARDQGHHQLAGGSTRRRVRAKTHDQIDRERNPPEAAAAAGEGELGLHHPAGGATQGRSALRALRNPIGNGRGSTGHGDPGAGLPMHVVYAVYIVLRGPTPLTQENQGLKKRGNPQIVLVHAL